MVEQTGNILAAAETTDFGIAISCTVISCAIIIIGAAMGIGLIGSKSVESIAR